MTSPQNNCAVMASRREPEGKGDFFPTPPWATRALCDVVLGLSGLNTSLSVWEPACGAGHMAEPLQEYFADVVASDLYDRGYGHLHGPDWDFLTVHPQQQFESGRFDWIITNPPYGLQAQQFVERALEHQPKQGVAVLVPLRWLETMERVETLFLAKPPHSVAAFADRVAMQKGHWNPNGATATAYCWIVWRTDRAVHTTQLIWVPPNTKKRLSKLCDLRLAAVPSDKAAEPGPLFSCNLNVEAVS